MLASAIGVTQGLSFEDVAAGAAAPPSSSRTAPTMAVSPEMADAPAEAVINRGIGGGELGICRPGAIVQDHKNRPRPLSSPITPSSSRPLSPHNGGVARNGDASYAKRQSPPAASGGSGLLVCVQAPSAATGKNVGPANKRHRIFTRPHNGGIARNGHTALAEIVTSLGIGGGEFGGLCPASIPSPG